MAGKREEVCAARCALSLAGLVMAVCILAAGSAGAQQPAVAPAGQAVATVNTPTTGAPTAGTRKPADEDYTVSPEDLLDVMVMDVPEISRTYRVSSNGLLTMPLLPEPIPVTGDTLNQLSHLIATKLHDAGMVNNAQVTVSLRETRRHSVMVTGFVMHPQAYPVFGPSQLLDVLVQSGGPANDAGDDVIITRGDAGMRADLEESARTGAVDPSAGGKSFTLNIRKLMQSGDPKANILVYPGDRVAVQQAQMIYIMGAVQHPGGYVLNESRKQVTVLKALAMAGDVTGYAKKSRITLLRHDPGTPEDKRDRIPVDYKGMVKGEIADMGLRPDDILYVPTSARLRAWDVGVNSAIQAVTGASGYMLIYH